MTTPPRMVRAWSKALLIYNSWVSVSEFNGLCAIIDRMYCTGIIDANIQSKMLMDIQRVARDKGRNMSFDYVWDVTDTESRISFINERIEYYKNDLY